MVELRPVDVLAVLTKENRRGLLNSVENLSPVDTPNSGFCETFEQWRIGLPVGGKHSPIPERLSLGVRVLTHTPSAGEDGRALISALCLRLVSWRE